MDVQEYLHAHYDEWLCRQAEEAYYSTERDRRIWDYTLENVSCDDCDHSVRVVYGEGELIAVDEDGEADGLYCEYHDMDVSAEDTPADHECYEYSGPTLDPDE